MESIGKSTSAHETQALTMFSLSFLENKGLIEKCGFDPKEKQYAFCLTDPTQELLDDLVKKHKGNRSLACMELLFEKCAVGEENALPEAALGFHMRVLHLIAFNEIPSKEDANGSDCDGDCDFCKDYTCPANPH